MLNVDELTAPEQALWLAVQYGEVADLSPPRTSSTPTRPNADSEWGPERTVSAHVLVELLTNTGLTELRKPRAVLIYGGRIKGALNLEGLELCCPIDLGHCYFDDNINLNEANTRRIRLRECYFGVFESSQVNIRGDLDLRGSTAERVLLRGARIKGQLGLDGIRLGPCDKEVLIADGMRVTESMSCRDASFKGELRMLGGRIGSQMILNKAHLSHEGSEAFCIDGSSIARNLVAEELIADGEIHMVDVHIGGQFDLTRSRLSHPNNDALSADGSRIDSDTIWQGLHVNGCVRIPGVRMNGQLDMKGVHLNNPSGIALFADRAKIAESARGIDDFVAVGLLSLRRIKVGGQLDLNNAHLENERGIALDAEGAMIQQLVLPRTKMAVGTIDLTDANIGCLTDAWPRVRYKPNLRGLIYETLIPLPQDISPRLDWLSSNVEGYVPQPYQQFAAVLRRAGRDDAARQVAMAKERKRRDQLNVFGRLVNFVLAITVGYGYQIWRGVLWLVFFALLGWPVSSWAKSSGHLTPILELSKPIPQFHAWLYSLDTVLPVINLGQKDYWAPTGAALYWHTASIIIGWLLVTVILGALTTRLIRD